MFFKSGTDGDGGSGLGTEQSNKIILLLLGGLILLIFMDAQAGRHYNDLAGKPGVRLPVEKKLEKGYAAARKHMRKAEDFLHREATTPANRVRERVGDVRDRVGRVRKQYRRTEEQYRRTASETRRLRGELDKQILKPIKKSAKEVFGSEYVDQVRSTLNNGGTRPAPKPIVKKKIAAFVHLKLHFIRFKRGRSQLVRVNRAVSGERLTPAYVLQLLQKGPLPQERGLLTAFTVPGTIRGFYKDQGIAFVDLSPVVASNSAKINRDRLDQIYYSLRQFPEIKDVRFLLEGAPVSMLGKLKIERVKPRKVLDYK